MTSKCGDQDIRRAKVMKPLIAYAIWMLVSASLEAPELLAQETALSVAVRAGVAGIFPSGIVRAVPSSSGGDRATRVADAAALSVGLSFSTGAMPVAIRLTAARSVGASLEHQEYRTQSCGANCTRTSGEYGYAGDASVTLLAADLAWTPFATWIVGPYVVVGLFRKTLAYDQSDLSSDIEPYFRSSDIAQGFRFGGGLTAGLHNRAQLYAELLHQRGRAGAPRMPETGEFWPRQRDVVLSAGLAVRVR